MPPIKYLRRARNFHLPAGGNYLRLRHPLRNCGSRTYFNQATRQSEVSRDRYVNSHRQRIEVRVHPACDNTAVANATVVQFREVVPVQGQDRPVQARCVLEHDFVGNAAIANADVPSSQYVMPGFAKPACYGHGKVLIRKKIRHAVTRSLVACAPGCALGA